jgi:hypothetical protein
MIIAKLLDESTELTEVIAALVVLYEGQGNMEGLSFQDILKDFLEREFIPLSQYKQDLLISRLVEAAAWLQATAQADDSQSIARYHLARKLDAMRYAIYRRLAERTPLPPSGGAWF